MAKLDQGGDERHVEDEEERAGDFCRAADVLRRKSKEEEKKRGASDGAKRPDSRTIITRLLELKTTASCE